MKEIKEEEKEEVEERCDKKEERGRPGGRSLLWAGAPHLAKEKCFFLLLENAKEKVFLGPLCKRKCFFSGI